MPVVDWGRFRLGDVVVVTALPTIMPDEPPVVTATLDGAAVPPAATRRMGYDRDRREFRASIRLGPGFGLGSYVVTVAYSVAGLPFSSDSGFTVVGGGDHGGAVISLYAFDRPEARHVVAQLDGGMLVQGRNPKL